MKLPTFLQIPNTFDPDDRRQRQILNIILCIFIMGGIFSVLATFSYGDPFLAIVQDSEGALVLVSSIAVIVVFTLLFFLNRLERAGSPAGWLFVLALIGIIFISDTPKQLLEGDLIFWTLPILAGGIVLPPRAVFAVALLISLVNGYLSVFILEASMNPYALGIFFLIAALTWLGMSVANSAIHTARNEAQKNAAILNGVADGVVVMDESDQIVLANPVALALMGNGLTTLDSSCQSQQELYGRVLVSQQVKDVG